MVVEVQPADLVPKTPQSAESTPRRLQKQIDTAIGDHRTSASMINAVVGSAGFSTRGENSGPDLQKFGALDIYQSQSSR